MHLYKIKSNWHCVHVVAETVTEACEKYNTKFGAIKDKQGHVPEILEVVYIGAVII